MGVSSAKVFFIIYIINFTLDPLKFYFENKILYNLRKKTYKKHMTEIA